MTATLTARLKAAGEALRLKAGFTGTVTDKRGRTLYYQQGKRVAAPQAAPQPVAGGGAGQAEPPPQQPKPAKPTAAQKLQVAASRGRLMEAQKARTAARRTHESAQKKLTTVRKQLDEHGVKADRLAGDVAALRAGLHDEGLTPKERARLAALTVRTQAQHARAKLRHAAATLKHKLAAHGETVTGKAHAAAAKRHEAALAAHAKVALAKAATAKAEPAAGPAPAAADAGRGGERPVGVAFDRQKVEADLARLNVPDRRTGIAPMIPELYDKLKEAHPGLTESAFHDVLADMQKQDKLTLQAWGGGSETGTIGGHPPERFPDRPAGGKAAWVSMRAAAPKPPEPGFSGTDSEGRKWEGGKLVAQQEAAPQTEASGAKVKDPLDLTPETVRGTWEAMRDEIANHDPKLSPEHAGSLAAARILNATGKRANEYIDDIDARVRRGEPITNEEDERYMAAGDKRKELSRELEKISGYRPYQTVDEHPLAQRPLDAPPLENHAATSAKTRADNERTAADVARRTADEASARKEKNRAARLELEKQQKETTDRQMATAKWYRENAGRGAKEGDRRAAVQSALAAGKPVPADVLKDYPDLAPKAKQEAPKAPDKPAAKAPAYPALEKPAHGPPNLPAFDSPAVKAVPDAQVDQLVAAARKHEGAAGAFVPLHKVAAETGWPPEKVAHVLAAAWARGKVSGRQSEGGHGGIGAAEQAHQFTAPDGDRIGRVQVKT